MNCLHLPYFLFSSTCDKMENTYRFHQQSSQLEWNEALPPQWGRWQPERADGGGVGGWMRCLSDTPKNQRFLPSPAKREPRRTGNYQLTHLLRSVDMHEIEKQEG